MPSGSEMYSAEHVARGQPASNEQTNSGDVADMAVDVVGHSACVIG